MQLQHNPTLRSIVVATAVLLIAGCTSQPKSADAAKPKAAQSKDEYIEVPVTGSNLTRKVKKGTKKPDDGTTQASAESLRQTNESAQNGMAREPGAPAPTGR